MTNTHLLSKDEAVISRTAVVNLRTHTIETVVWHIELVLILKYVVER